MTTDGSSLADIEAQLRGISYGADVAAMYNLPVKAAQPTQPTQPIEAQQGPAQPTEPTQPTPPVEPKQTEPQESKIPPVDNTEKERIPKVLSERNALRTEVIDLKQQLEDLQSRLSMKENQESLTPEESREYIKDTARIEALTIRQEDMEKKDLESFYNKFPDASEHKSKIEELIANAPSLDREFLYRAINPYAFVEEALINQAQPMKYAAPSGPPPADLGQPKSIDQLSGDELKAELTKAFASLRG